MLSWPQVSHIESTVVPNLEYHVSRIPALYFERFTGNPETNTVWISPESKPWLVVTFIKWPPALKAQYFVISGVYCNSRLVCISQPPAFNGHFTLSLEWLPKMLTRFDCKTQAWTIPFYYLTDRQCTSELCLSSSQYGVLHVHQNTFRKGKTKHKQNKQNKQTKPKPQHWRFALAVFNRLSILIDSEHYTRHRYELQFQWAVWTKSGCKARLIDLSTLICHGFIYLSHDSWWSLTLKETLSDKK